MEKKSLVESAAKLISQQSEMSEMGDRRLQEDENLRKQAAHKLMHSVAVKTLADVRKEHAAAAQGIIDRKQRFPNEKEQENRHDSAINTAFNNVKIHKAAYVAAGGDAKDLEESTALSEMGDEKGGGVLHHFGSEKDRQKELDDHKKDFEEAIDRRNKAMASAMHPMTPEKDRSTHLAVANQAHSEAQEHAKKHTQIMSAGLRDTHKPHVSLYGEFESKMPKSTPRQEFDKFADRQRHSVPSSGSNKKYDHMKNSVELEGNPLTEAKKKSPGGMDHTVEFWRHMKAHTTAFNDGEHEEAQFHVNVAVGHAKRFYDLSDGDKIDAGGAFDNLNSRYVRNGYDG